MRKVIALLGVFYCHGFCQGTLEDAIGRIERRHGDKVIAERSDTTRIREVTLICIKDERALELWINRAFVKRYAMTAFSGGPGPKLREGDGQIPEGIYQAEYLNPNSSYHLSIKVGYPNAWDRAWARDEGRSRLGGDIFIHGEDVTIGCIPIGNRNIEEVFWAVYQAKPAHTRILISPWDFRKPGWKNPAARGRLRDLYHALKDELAAFRRETRSGSAPD